MSIKNKKSSSILALLCFRLAWDLWSLSSLWFNSFGMGLSILCLLNYSIPEAYNLLSGFIASQLRMSNNSSLMHSWCRWYFRWDFELRLDRMKKEFVDFGDRVNLLWLWVGHEFGELDGKMLWDEMCPQQFICWSPKPQYLGTKLLWRQSLYKRSS